MIQYAKSMRDRYFHRKSLESNSPNRGRRWIGAALGLIALAVLVYNIPAVNSRLAWRVDNLRTRIVYMFNPPDEAIFVPQEENATEVASGAAVALTPQPTFTPSAATPTNQPTEVPLPATVSLQGFTYTDQHNRWNYCGPANLTMALSYWGWTGNRDDVANYVKPGINNTDGKEDKNVMPAELQDFVNTQVPGMQAIVRHGGDIDLVRNLIAKGFPVIVEKGYYERDYTGKVAWLGHYLYVTGYDDVTGTFTVQDAYLRTGEDVTGDGEKDGANLLSPYAEFQSDWRSFNYLFIVVYPEARAAELTAALGPWADEAWADANALQIAQAEAQTLTGIDQFFAWFNVGSSHVRLFQYVDAAFAYDYAFQIYSSLTNDSTQRPYRIMWYQTGPYWAYYYSARYQDVINLANQTLFETIDEPTLEESLYWRGLAREAIGETDNAIADYRETVRLNPNFGPGLAQLARLGVSP
jgi:hypothetical protein